MICDHVAQGSSLFVITGTTADATSFSSGDLHVVDVVAIPDRLKHRVAKTKYEYVLNCIFAEVVIDAIDLILLEHFGNRSIQSLGRFEIAAKRLFDNDAAPVVLLVGEAGFTQVFHDLGEKRGRSSEVEEPVPGCASGRELFQTRCHVAVSFLIVELT